MPVRRCPFRITKHEIDHTLSPVASAARRERPSAVRSDLGVTWHHPTAQLFEITKYGSEAVVGGGYRSNMMGFGDVLTDEQILATLAYIKSTWPSRIVERHDEMDAAYEAARP